MTSLFIQVVNMSISASWLVLAVLLLRFALKKAPKWSCVLLWGIVALRLVLPFSLESAFSLIPSSQTISPEIMVDHYPQISTGVPELNDVVNPMFAERFAPAPGDSANPLQILIPVAAVIWLTGIALMLVYTAVSYWHLRRKVDTAVLLRENIFQSEFINSPFVLGVLKPKIFLPYALTAEEAGHVIAHEQAHILRRDHWWKPLGFLLLALHWFNPLMWVAYVLLCRDIELACDEKVIRELGDSERADYTQALVACSVSRRMIAACPLAFGEVGVKARVKSVLNYKKPTFWIIAAAIVVCLAVAVCFLTNPVELDYDVNALYCYGTVLDQGTDENARGFLSFQSDDGETLTFWTKEEGMEFVSLAGRHVLVEGWKEEKTGMLIAQKVVVTQNTWADNADDAIQNAVLDHFWTSWYDSAEYFSCADFEILANEEGASASGDGTRIVTFYGLVLHQLFYVEDKEVAEKGGSHIPTVLTFEIDEAGRYILKEYWEPRDGSNYTRDIKEKFPAFVWPDTQKYIGQQEQRNLARATEYFRLAQQAPAQTETVPVSPNLDVVSDMAYFMELSMPDKTFRDMEAASQNEILAEYGALLDGYTLLPRESEDGAVSYIVGCFDGIAEENPFSQLCTVHVNDLAEKVQLLYNEENTEAVEHALANREFPADAYVIRKSTIDYSSKSGHILITPIDTGWGLNGVFHMWLSPNGRDYMLDAASRGIAFCEPEGPYLEVHLITEKWGALSEFISLTEREAEAILQEKGKPLEKGYGFCGELHAKGETVYYLDGSVPQTVLDLAVQKCGYRFETPQDIQGTMVEARLDCPWLEKPLYAGEADLEKLQRILTNARFCYVGRCGYGAKLTIQMDDGSTMVLFKGTDSCDTIVFGSYGGYSLGEQENLDFWELFGVDMSDGWPQNS